MSSIRNAAYRRNHPERPQPKARRQLGLLEKHKDYVQRARDHHKKQDALKRFKEKATLRNPDEFYFSMSRARTSRGVHIVERNNKLPLDVVRLIKDQHLKYINCQESVNRKKLSELENSAKISESIGLRVQSDDTDAEESGPARKNSPQHTIFVDGEEDLGNFDPVKHFGTYPERMGIKGNRIRIEQLETQNIPTLKKDSLESIMKNHRAMQRELRSRTEREIKLKDAQREYQLRKNIASKGAKVIIGKDSNGLKTYRWRQFRKR